MKPRKTYFACGLLLLLLSCAAFLIGGQSVRPEVTQLNHRHFLVRSGLNELSVILIPMLISCGAVCGALGCIQPWVALPLALKRLGAILFTGGIGLLSAASVIVATVTDYSAELMKMRWTAFAGYLLIAATILLNILGLAFHGVGRIAQGNLEKHQKAEGVTMKAAKLYSLGGLLMILSAFTRAFWPGWPWEVEMTAGLTFTIAILWASNAGAALGASAFFLAAMQSYIPFHERLKMFVAIAYLVGSGVFLISLRADMIQERWFDSPMSWTTTCGLAVIVSALLANMIGVLRQHEPEPASNVPASV